MTAYIFPGIGLAILLIGAAAAVKHRHNTKKCISSITLGVLVATFFMVLPTQWCKEGAQYVSQPPYIALSSLLYSFKAVGGRQDIAQLESIALTGALKTAYIYINYLCFALMPISASSLVLSFFGDFSERIRLLFRLGGTCHVFSELNDNSLVLAKGIKHTKKGNTLVFCNTRGASEALVEQARKLGGIALYSDCVNIRTAKKFGRFRFYLICRDEDSNIRDALALIKKHRSSKRDITVNAFAQSDANIKVVESMERGNLRLRFINETALLCNQLLYRHPLYALPGDRKDISVMIVGCGATGMQMAKAVAWAGQIEGYTLKLRIYDKAAGKLRDQFFADCPELALPEYDIAFAQCDIEGQDFEQAILAAGQTDASYVVIATGSDRLNIQTADRLRGIFRRLGEHISDEPPIFIRVRSGLMQANSSDYLTQRNIIPFGNIAEIFSKTTLFNSELEQLAFAVHLCYNDLLDVDDPEALAKARNSFESSCYNRRSSMAAALHIQAKLHSFRQLSDAENDKQARMLFAMELEKEVSPVLDRLYRNEHARWNAFMRSEGYCKAQKEEMVRFQADCGKHKDALSKLHPCLVSWEELDEVGKEYFRVFGEKDTFKDYDIAIVRNSYRLLEYIRQDTERS